MGQRGTLLLSTGPKRDFPHCYLESIQFSFGSFSECSRRLNLTSLLPLHHSRTDSSCRGNFSPFVPPRFRSRVVAAPRVPIESARLCRAARGIGVPASGKFCVSFRRMESARFRINVSRSSGVKRSKGSACESISNVSRSLLVYSWTVTGNCLLPLPMQSDVVYSLRRARAANKRNTVRRRRFQIGNRTGIRNSRSNRCENPFFINLTAPSNRILKPFADRDGFRLRYRARHHAENRSGAVRLRIEFIYSYIQFIY